MLLCGRDVVALREILNYLLSKPAPLEEPGLGVGKAPLAADQSALGPFYANEEAHTFRLGTMPLSVGWRPRLSGLAMSTCLLVPPAVGTRSAVYLGLEGRKRGNTQDMSSLPIAIDGLSLLKLRTGNISFVRAGQRGQSCSLDRVGGGQDRKVERESHGERLVRKASVGDSNWGAATGSKTCSWPRDRALSVLGSTQVIYTAVRTEHRLRQDPSHILPKVNNMREMVALWG